MNAFQIIALPSIALAWFSTVHAIRTGRVSRGAGLIWLAIWTAGSVVIAVPDLSTWIAQRLGIQRGVDVVMYASILLLMAVSMRLYIQQRRLEQDITRLVRHIALNDARGPSS